jgi:hypothetical protein
MWDILYNHLYTCCERNQWDTYHTQLRKYNTAIKLYCFMCVKGIPSSFLRHKTIKLFKGSDLNLSYLQSVWWIYSGRKIYYTTIKYYDMVWLLLGTDVWTLGSARRRCNWRHGRLFYSEVFEGERCRTIKNRCNGRCRSLRHKQNNAIGRHGWLRINLGGYHLLNH